MLSINEDSVSDLNDMKEVDDNISEVSDIISSSNTPSYVGIRYPTTSNNIKVNGSRQQRDNGCLACDA